MARMHKTRGGSALSPQTPCFHAIDSTIGGGYTPPVQHHPRVHASGAYLLHDQTSSPVTELLVRWRSGDSEALDSLMPLVYDEMRRLAHRYLRRERPDHTLQSTALVHEAY